MVKHGQEGGERSSQHVRLTGRRLYRRTGSLWPRRRRRVGSSPVSEQVRLPEHVGVAVSASLEEDPAKPIIGCIYRQIGWWGGRLESEARAAR